MLPRARFGGLRVLQLRRESSSTDILSIQYMSSIYSEFLSKGKIQEKI